MATITKCDVAIIGGGISGTALLYLLAKYTDLSNICLVEKCQDIARSEERRVGKECRL